MARRGAAPVEPSYVPPEVVRGYSALALAAAGALAWMWCLEVDAGGRFVPVLAWSALPWALLLGGFVRRHWRWMRARYQGSWRALARVAFVYAAGLFAVWPNLMAVNAAIDRGPVRLTGPVVSLHPSSHRLGDRDALMFHDWHSRREVSLPVDEALFASAHPGLVVSCQLRQGWLGFPFRWRFGAPGPLCVADSQATDSQATAPAG